MNEAHAHQQMIRSKQDKLAAFIAAHPEALDELFRFARPKLRELAMADTTRLDAHDTGLLHDRMEYIRRTRIVHQREEAPRCGGKVIHTEREAHAAANRIWRTGRGQMRVYHCPLCKGHHLTHTAQRDADQRVA